MKREEYQAEAACAAYRTALQQGSIQRLKRNCSGTGGYNVTCIQIALKTPIGQHLATNP